MWDSFTTGTSNLKRRTYLSYEIFNFRGEIEKQKNEFGVLAFDHMRTFTLTFDNNSMLESICRKFDIEVRVLEVQIMEKESKGDSTRNLERKINKTKAELGAIIFAYTRNIGRECNDVELENMYKKSLEIIRSLEIQIEERKPKAAELL